MKKLIIISLLSCLGFLSYSQSRFDPLEIVNWTVSAKDTAWEFIMTADYVYGVYVWWDDLDTNNSYVKLQHTIHPDSTWVDMIFTPDSIQLTPKTHGAVIFESDYKSMSYSRLYYNHGNVSSGTIKSWYVRARR